MTISTELRKAGPFTGNGVTTAFPFSFKVFAATDVTVTRADTLGAETGLVLNTDFTVAINADQDAAPGGTVTLAAPLSTGYRLVVSSAVPNLQPTDITNNGGFYPRVIEDALDRQVAQIQQIAEQAARAVKVKITDTTDPDQLVADLIADAESARTAAAGAASSEANAAASKAAAASSASAASTSATSAAGSASSASSSAASAAASQSAAAGSASSASSSAASAAASQSAAASSETNAQASATTASTKASEAAAYAVAAAAAASNAEIAFDSFDDKYLGSKANDPATDNDGSPLLTGALYWNTTVGAVRVWNGSAWLSMAADASIVDFQQAGAGAVVRTAQDKLREWVSVKDFGAVGDGVTDDTAAIQSALSAHEKVVIPPGTYRTTGTVSVVSPHTIHSFGAVIAKDFDGVGLSISGGSAFNNIYGDLQVIAVGEHVANTASDSASPNAHGITISNNRVMVFGSLTSAYHKGCGILFSATAPNSNRSLFNNLRVRFNGVHGIRFSGTNDDCSVWQINIYADGNRKSGIACDHDFMGRNWSGFWYSENNAFDGTSHCVDIAKLRTSELCIYAEQQNSALEIVLGSGCENLQISSFRRNKDEDRAPAGNNIWRWGAQEYSPGYAGDARTAVAGVIRGDRIRATSSGDYLVQKYQGASSADLGSVRAGGGTSSPFIGLYSADGSSTVAVANDRFSVAVAGATMLRSAGGALTLGSGTFSNVGASSGMEIDATTLSLKSSRNSTTARNHLEFFNPNGKVGGISTSASATTYATTSDVRAKKNVQDAPPAGDIIDTLRVVSFDWKAGGGHCAYGMIAQDVYEVFPDAVARGEGGELWGVDYSKLVPILLLEVQRLRRACKMSNTPESL